MSEESICDALDCKLLQAAAQRPSTTRALTVRVGGGRSMVAIGERMQRLEGFEFVVASEIGGVVIWSATAEGKEWAQKSEEAACDE
jgi:hypothetical protein